ncbi:putative ubiquitin carboxyl-terminal hydrolase K02C4.3 [Psilocybe cubensis]|uniref:USP domain-containing protein n=2 Tax=Psilocybe cubensis TaxID=181762 RepID=A0A8H8CGR0_PSICU|nr:putative ubiquitin carboxyl-terminal hydrolase K02C4.3 [Psilocybe cubensis]KAH9474579.1 putative ubiquitin carboxyl-terminal hydrolase K02C4.3 [Psilocybe cubensis]
MQLSLEQERLEQNNGDLLAQISNVDTQVARRVLRKFNGDMEKAADALLAGDRALDWETKHRNTPEPTYSDGKDSSKSVMPAPSTSVIDLTADDDEMTRALQMSMDESSQVSKFGPSDRAPNPEWAMVRSNDPIVPGTTNEDHTLNEAIQASLQDFQEDVDVSPFSDSLREGGRPIALRTRTKELAYGALVIQALFFIPQVRATVSNFRLPRIEPSAQLGHPSRIMWNLIELFTNMDLAQLAAIIDNELLPAMFTERLTPGQSLPDASADIVKHVAGLIEQHAAAQATEEDEMEERLFSFTHGNVVLNNQDAAIKSNRSSEDGIVVTVEYGDSVLHNDLISCISDNLNKIEPTCSSHDVIIRPSDVITFQLRRLPNASSSKTSPDPFVYPKSLYLDRFMFDNLAFTNNKRKQERRMLEEIENLKAQKEKLTRSDNRDSLQTLRNTVYYYEFIAKSDGDRAREARLQRVTENLRDILTGLEAKVEDIDRQIEKLQAEVAVVYDCPELQQYQYDLRAVLVHSGLPGRKHIYSYVQDIEGVWWKTVDHEVTEVPEETVLTDPTGLHLGAGPYMLFYSRHLTHDQLHEPLVWPNVFSEAVADNNKKFLAMMHPELEIFSNASLESPEIQPTPRALPIPQERQHTRDSSRNMIVDEPTFSLPPPPY